MYELATLKPAFGDGDRAELVQKIRDASTPPPRSIDPRIPADLETIILKAVAREPAQRYRTAGLLGEDLERFLAGQPIQARRTSVLEKSRLWCRRNPAIAMLLLMLFAALTTGFATSSWYWRKATLRANAAKVSEEKSLAMAKIATRRAQEADQANELAATQRDVATQKAKELRAAIDQLFSAIADDPLLKTVALEKFRRKMLERANTYYAQFHTETPDDPELAYQHAQLTFKLAEMNRELGDLRTAKRLFANILRDVEEAEKPNPALFPIAYKCRLWLADCSWKLGEEDDQLSYLIGEAEKFIETHSPATAAKFLTECAHMALNVRRVSDAWALSNQADQLWTSIEPVPGMQRQHDLRVALHSTTRCQLALQVEEYDLARAAARRAIELLTPYGPSQMVTATIADMDYLIAVSYSRERRYEEAAEKYRHVIEVFGEMQKAHPDVLRYRTKLMDYHYHLGLDLHRQNKHQEALEILETTLQKLDEIGRQFPDLSIEHKRLRGDALNVVSGIHARLGNYEDQGRFAQLAIDAFEEIRGGDANPLILSSLGNAWAHRGNYLVNVMADRAEQIAAYDQAIGILGNVVTQEPKSTQARQFLAEACFEQAMIHLAAGDRALTSQRLDQASELDAGEYSERARNEKQRLAEEDVVDELAK